MNKFNQHYYLFFTFKENINLLLYSFSWLTTNNDDIPNSTSLVNCTQNIYYAVHLYLLQLTKTKETIFCFLHQVLILLTYRVFFFIGCGLWLSLLPSFLIRFCSSISHFLLDMIRNQMRYRSWLYRNAVLRKKPIRKRRIFR